MLQKVTRRRKIKIMSGIKKVGEVRRSGRMRSRKRKKARDGRREGKRGGKRV